jgi:hypothetical protein
MLFNFGAVEMSNSTIRLPACLTVDQFAFLTQLHVKTVQRKCRARVIKAFGRPFRIPPRELLEFGVTLEDAAVALHSRKSMPASPASLPSAA